MSNLDIKVPRHSPHSKVERAIARTPQDGQWHQLLTMANSTAEQTARAYNVPGGNWELGYTHQPSNVVVDGVESVLWARWIG